MKARMNFTRPGLAGMPLIAAALAVAAAIAVPPGGAEAGNGPGLQPEALVSALRANGAEIVPLGARGGVNGYFVTPAKGAGYSLYVTEDGHAVAGLLYGPDGMELTGAQLAAARARDAGTGPAHAAAREKAETSAAVIAHAETGSAGRPSSSASLARLFERSAAAFGFTLGERGPLVVLLGDPTCSFSRSAAARLGRAALDGRLQLRVVPVAVLGADAARRAVAIAAHRDPARAWFEGGGAADRTLVPETLGPETLGPETGAERIARNNALFDEWGASAVPLIAWRTRDPRAGDGAVRHRIGDIDDVGVWLGRGPGRLRYRLPDGIPRLRGDRRQSAARHRRAAGRGGRGQALRAPRRHPDRVGGGEHGDAVVGGLHHRLDGLPVARLAHDHGRGPPPQAGAQTVREAREVAGDLGRGHQRGVRGDAVEDVLDRRLVGLDAARAAFQQVPGAGREQRRLARARHAGDQDQPLAEVPRAYDPVLDAELCEGGRPAGKHAQRYVDRKARRALDWGEVAAETAAMPARQLNGVRAVDGAARAQDALAGGVVDPAVTAAALDLTVMEGRVAVLLARGMSVRETAAATGRKESTIRSHVKHIFAKHGLSRQAELVRLVLLLAGAPEARR